MHQGLALTFYTDDADDHGQPDDLLIDGVVQYNLEERCWVAAVDWSTLSHASKQAAAPDGQRRQQPIPP